MEESNYNSSQKRNRRSDIISMLIMVFLAVFCIGSLINHASYVEESQLRIEALENEISSLEKTNSHSSALSYSSSSLSKTSSVKESNSGGRTIYATPTGEKYHYASPCGRGTYYKCTWDEVEERGLEPCKKCVLNLP